MRLKSVRIFGFKTFAERTEFTLEGGIVAVVGPNGCGKSNLVDAILWGLGEGNSRHLRAQSGQDVIFNGSAHRKGVGFCEVTLLFDNEDGTLPVPSPEVSVTRRLSRNGETEYSINRRSCRQRDIYELLADSGLGRTGYSIVGQRQIDQALSASSEERRAWIDEAAGVQRYRQRKIEALRKLDGAREHLLRVADILGELDSQREPLREQAHEAAQYRRIQSALRETEIGYLDAEVKSAAVEQERLQIQIEVAAKLIEAETFRANAYEAKVLEIQGEVAGIERSITEGRAKGEQARNQILKASADIRIHEAKLESLAQQESGLKADHTEIAARIEEAEAEVERVELEFRVEEEQAQEVRQATAGYGEATRQLSNALDESERQLKAASQRETLRLRREADRKQLLEKRGLATRELNSLEKDFSNLEASVSWAKRAVETATEELESRKGAAKDLLSQEFSLKSREDKEASEVRTILSERAALEGRERGIEATIDGLEGMNQGSRAVMEAAAKGHLKGSYYPVGHAVQVGKEHALAIETALGGAVNDLIVVSEVDSKEAIEYLKSQRGGRATFQPIGLMRPVEKSPELRKMLLQPSVVGLADELVTCDPQYRPVIESLLGRVLVVDNLTTALKLAKTRGWSRIATLEGEIVFSSGAVTGGAQARHSYGILQRKSDLATLRKQIDGITDLVSKYHVGSKEREKEAVEIGARLSQLRLEIQDAEEALSDAKGYFRTLEDELKSTVKERERLRRELANPVPDPEAQGEDITSFEAVRDAALRSLAAKSADAQLGEERLRESEKRLGQARVRLETAIRRREGALQSEHARARKAESVAPEKARLHDLVTTDSKLRDSAIASEESAQKSVKFVEALKASRLEDRDAQVCLARVARQTLADTSNLLHQAEISRTRCESKRFAALTKLGEEYGLAESDLVEMALEPVPSDAISVISRLRRELRAMGSVNLGAIEAFERLTVRFDELQAQSEDINGGIEEVEKSIKELDHLTRDRFLTTFAELQKTFSATFEKVFSGGSGSIHLTQPDDVLSSGIEIDVTLPGKRRQPLTLLSGGEQSLCTSVLLFSLLQVKPSPLVVLDEIDAPLDGRNVERYAELLKELSKTMQFIVITHNPVTIESATTWLGVTMQEPGISTLIPTKVPERVERTGSRP